MTAGQLTDVDLHPEPVTEYEYDVPAGEEPETTCPYCGRPFRVQRYATYHLDVAHPDELSNEERAAVEDVRDDEEHELFTFHVKAAVSVFLTYFLFTFIYALVWAG
ncbi:hypothetical protein HT576_16045 [Haloterrigena sp. SYSU A121-1]|uniref:C2H2-type domain-containing protein n=1 Tax=Haloterrigena gelatinilytica TaxID=2741724 RepID=A0A8J8GNM9_9EURY|nr:hypothetical protein [Haloterrigena gelatinilytica]NUB92523.1 hypothetical protein [Haloterrigena gelatinilytica]